MLSLTVYAGVGQIGGNQVLVEDGDTRFFFDFGLPYAHRYRYFEEYLNPRPGAGLLDPLEMGLLPPLKGIYRPDLEPPGVDLWSRFSSRPYFRELEVDGVLLSHGHMDHAGYISFLRTDIPVYASPTTAFVLKATQDSGKSDFEKEICYAAPRKDKEGYLGSAGGSRQQRPFAFLGGPPLGPEAMEYWNTSDLTKGKMDCSSPIAEPGRIGGLVVGSFPVDHSVPGACALGVETSAGWAMYTGDLRFHGHRGHCTREFVHAAALLRPAVLLGEGSNVGEGLGTTEEEVYHNARRAVGEARGFVVADFAPRNVERLLTFRRIAQEVGRQIVVLPKDAYLLDKLSLVAPELVKPGFLSGVLVYRQLRDEGRLKPWQRELQERSDVRFVDAAAIRSRPAEFLVCFSFFDVKEIVSINPEEGVYIYSSSEAYTEEQEMDFRRLLNWLQHFGMTFVGDSHLHHRFQDTGQCPSGCPFCSAPPGTVRLAPGFHASGHASGGELVEMIKAIHPKVFVPVHTEKPEYFREVLAGTGIEVRLPQAGVSMALP